MRIHDISERHFQDETTAALAHSPVYILISARVSYGGGEFESFWDMHKGGSEAREGTMFRCCESWPSVTHLRWVGGEKEVRFSRHEGSY